MKKTKEFQIYGSNMVKGKYGQTAKKINSKYNQGEIQALHREKFEMGKSFQTERAIDA